MKNKIKPKTKIQFCFHFRFCFYFRFCFHFRFCFSYAFILVFVFVFVFAFVFTMVPLSHHTPPELFQSYFLSMEVSMGQIFHFSVHNNTIL